MPTHNPNKSRDLKRDQLFDMWRITTRRHLIQKVPDDHEIQEIKRKFMDMLPMEELEEWRSLKSKYSDVMEAVENTLPKHGAPPKERAARVELRRFFQKIGHQLSLDICELREEIRKDPKKDLLVKMFRTSLFQQEFLSWESPENIKMKFLHTLQPAHTTEFLEIQDKYGKDIWWNMEGDILNSYSLYNEVVQRMQEFFNKIAKTLDMSIVDLYAEGSPRKTAVVDDSVLELEEDNTLLGLRIMHLGPLGEEQLDDDDDTVMGETDRTYMN